MEVSRLPTVPPRACLGALLGVVFGVNKVLKPDTLFGALDATEGERAMGTGQGAVVDLADLEGSSGHGSNAVAASPPYPYIVAR